MRHGCRPEEACFYRYAHFDIPSHTIVDVEHFHTNHPIPHSRTHLQHCRRRPHTRSYTRPHTRPGPVLVLLVRREGTSDPIHPSCHAQPFRPRRVSTRLTIPSYTSTHSPYALLVFLPVPSPSPRLFSHLTNHHLPTCPPLSVLLLPSFPLPPPTPNPHTYKKQATE